MVPYKIKGIQLLISNCSLVNQRAKSPIVLSMVYLEEKQLAREEKGRMVKKQTQSIRNKKIIP